MHTTNDAAEGKFFTFVFFSIVLDFTFLITLASMQCLLHMRLCATRVGEGVHLKQERNGRAAGSEPWPIYCLSPKLSFPLVQTHQGPDKLPFPLQLYSSGQAVLKNSSCMIVFWSAAKWKISTLGIFYRSLMWWTGSDYGCSVKLWNMDLWIMIGLI